MEEALQEPTFEGILATLLELHARQRGKVRGGEKTPMNVLYLDQILAGFPDSPILYLMRDPRDVVLSMSKAWKTPIREAAEVWNSYGVNRERWRRGMFRWRVSGRARLRHAVLSGFRRVGLLSS